MGRWFNVLVALGCVGLAVPLLAYGYLGQFSRYAADDYCTAGQLVANGLLGMQVELYEGWSGRFAFSLVVGLLELLGPSVVPWLPTVGLITWLAALSWALRGLGADWPVALLGALTLVFATLSSTPDLGQSLLWQTGLLTYVLPLILGAVFVGLVVREMHAVWLQRALALVLMLVIGGTSETSVAVAIAALGSALALVVLVGSPAARSRLVPLLAAGLVGALIAFALVLLAPGNAVRQTGNEPNLRFALGAALTDSRQFFHDWWRFTTLSMVTALFVPAGVAFFDPRQSTPGWRTPALLVVCAIVCLLLVYVALLPPFYALGAPAPGRARVIPQFMLALGTAFVGYAAGLSARQLLPRVAAAPSALAACALVLVAVLVLGPGRATRDAVALASSASDFAIGWDAIDRQIRAAREAGADDIRVPALAMNGPIRGMDFLSRDPADWLNDCAARFYGVQSLRAE